VTDVELIVDWVQAMAADMRGEIEGMSPEELAWQPDPEANSIGVTVWHVCRWLDLLTVQILEGRPAEEEQWHTRGSREQTGYDPRGIGLRGFGAISGYTLEEVAAVPSLTATEHTTYLTQVCDALCERLNAMPEGDLHQPTLGLGGKRTPYQWVKILLPGCFGHLGEIAALKAMRSRETYYPRAVAALS
jgi:hypothetical protein